MSNDWNFGDLNLTDVKAGGSRLPEGVYHVQCTDARLEDGMGSNKKLVLELKAVDGSGDIRQILNIKHTSERAQEIALRQLKTFLVSAGHPTPDNPKDIGTLKNLECKIRVAMGNPWKNSEGKEVVSTEVKSFMPLDDAIATDDKSSDKSDNIMDDDIPF
jgi:hypothetical protein